MGHRCLYIASLKVDTINGKFQPLIEIEARWKKNSEIVYREAEDGYCESRYIYFSRGACGYITTFPNERTSWYYGYQVQETSRFYQCEHCNINCDWTSKEDDFKELEKYVFAYPYLNKKYSGYNIWTYMNLRRRYKDNPNIEMLVENDRTRIACDKRLSKLSKEKRSQVLRFIKDNPNCQSLSHALFCINHNVELKDIKYYASCKYSYEIGNYLSKQNENYRFYQDYIKLCKECEKDLNQDYWKYPSNLRERHKFLLDMKDDILAAKKARENKELNEILHKIGSSYKGIEIDGYTVYVPDSLDDIAHQAKVLSQCLMQCNYYKKMAEYKCVLVFIKKDDVPIATAEIDKDKSIVQFYADEKDRNNCKPSDDVKNVLHTYLNDFKYVRATV